MHFPGKILYRKIGAEGIIVFLLLVVMVHTSCKNDIEVINTLTSISNLPTQSVSNIESIYSDSARIQIRVRAPQLHRYGNATDPYMEFPAGIEVCFYNRQEEISSQLTAKFAIYYEGIELWEARDSVVAINVAGEILNTDLLFWNEKKGLIYSNKFVKITTPDEVIFGEGFEANQDFTDWVIKNPKGTIYLDDE